MLGDLGIYSKPNESYTTHLIKLSLFATTQNTLIAPNYVVFHTTLPNFAIVSNYIIKLDMDLGFRLGCGLLIVLG